MQKDATGTTQINFAGGTVRVANADLTTNVPMTLSGTSSTIDTAGLNALLSGSLSGVGSLEKTGLGTLTLSATNTFTGETKVTGGSLLVNGILNDVRVKSGGLLGGIGSAGNITLDGGTLAPGISEGTLSGASLNWLEGKIAFDLGADASSSDLIVLTGGLTDQGALFDFTFGNLGWQAGQTYKLIQFGSSGIPLSSFAYTNTDGLQGQFVYDSNALSFELAAVPEPGTVALVSIGFLALGVWSRRRSA